MDDVVHAAPRGVTKEWFDVLEYPRFPCGEPTYVVNEPFRSWKPRLWQVTCEVCLEDLRDGLAPITYDPSDGSAKGVRG